MFGTIFSTAIRSFLSSIIHGLSVPFTLFFWLVGRIIPYYLRTLRFFSRFA